LNKQAQVQKPALSREATSIMSHYDIVQRYRDGDVALCNCAGCNRELLSNRHRAAYELAERQGVAGLTALPPFVSGRIKDRPYCGRCLKSDRPPSLAENLTPRQASKLQNTSS